MTSIAWHPLARRELFESSGFYEKEVSGLGEIFLDRIEEVLAQIRRHPHSGPPILGEIRKCRVARFPYNLVLPDRVRSSLHPGGRTPQETPLLLDQEAVAGAPSW